jgi:hypothetical protein
MTDGPAPPSPLQPEDVALLMSLRQSGEWFRAVLCTLARRGRGFRETQPQRTRALLDALSVYPWYKGGQFLFDLMEWEDFMLMEPAPPLVPTVLDAGALGRITDTLNQIRQHLDGTPVMQAAPIVAVAVSMPEDLPRLEASMYLYEDVVLGVVSSYLPSFGGDGSIG